MIEILAIQIKNNNDIKGRPLQNTTTLNDDNGIKIVQHADDCTNLLTDTKTSKKLLETITDLSNVAGPKLNPEKKPTVY